MSMTTGWTSTPASVAMANSLAAASRLRSVAYTSWPRPASCTAVARPMPEFEPVTTETGTETGVVMATP